MLIEDIGATESVAELFRRHHVSLVRLAIQFVDSQADAEDVVQDVFAALEPDRIVGTAERHLTRAVLERCRSLVWRRRAVRLFRRAAPTVRDVPAADGTGPTSERARTILAGVDALPTREREVLVLQYFAGRSVVETAGLLGITPHDVASSSASALTGIATARSSAPTDRPAADDAARAPADLETELRAVLRRRGAVITPATLLRPRPPAPPESRARSALARPRVIGAVVVVGVVVLAIVLGREVVAPQQAQTGAEQGASTSSAAEPPMDPELLGGRLWGATSVSTSGESFSDPEWQQCGARTMTVEFSAGGGVVFRDGRSEVRGQFVPGAGGLTITGATGWTAPVSRANDHFEQSTALGGLLAGMPAPVRVDAALVGDELVLAHGDTEIRYVVSGVIPVVAQRAGSGAYPVAGAIGETWVASRIFTGNDDRLVPQSPRTDFTLAPAGTIVVRQGSVASPGRWWATSAGLMTIGVPALTARYEVDPSGDGGATAGVQYSVLAALQAMTSGAATIEVSTDGEQLRVTPDDGPQIPVTFVRD